jgi:hypothetical protein
MPTFPGKKWFGTLDRDFLKRRSKEIDTFLNMFLKHPDVIKQQSVPVYFSKRAVAQNDKQAIEDLVVYISNKKPKMNQ